MSAEWFERNAKFAEGQGFVKLAAQFQKRKRNWHIWATENWNKVGWSHNGSVDETAEKLTAVYAEQDDKPLSEWRVPRHVLRKLALDLMCASFPERQPPPAALVQLMKHALELPESHEVGSWPLIAGTHDDRGSPDHEMRTMAMSMDEFYFKKHGAFMPLRELARGLEIELHRKPDRTRLRQWRREAGLRGDGDK
jgi:hypothetical protein